MAASIKVVYYCSSQASNQLICAELCSTLINRGHSVIVVAENGFTCLNHLENDVKFQHIRLKGNKQHGLSLEPKQGIALVDSEAAWLRAQKADVVICGAVPFGSLAAAAAGICAVCIANSTGDSVHGQQHQPGSSNPWDNGIGYALATILLRLPGHAPMLSFNHIVDIPLIVPHAKISQEQVRAYLHIEESRYTILTSADEGLTPLDLSDHWQELPHLSNLEEYFEKLAEQLSISVPSKQLALTQANLVSIATCVVGPLEYSTATLCLAHSVPFIYVKQGKSIDEPFICSLLQKHALGMEMALDIYNSSGTLWEECLEKLENWNRKKLPVSTYSEPTNGAEVVAEILEHIGQEKGPKPHGMGPHAAIALQRSLTKSGSIRLKDTLMLAHMMDHEASKQKIVIPAWYSQDLSQEMHELSLQADKLVPALLGPRSNTIHQLLVSKGDRLMAQQPDAQAFLRHMAQLASPAEFLPGRSSHTVRLYRQGRVHVARAAHSIGLFGGVCTDYSGGLCLHAAMPQAYFVACQLQPMELSQSRGDDPLVRLKILSADKQEVLSDGQAGAISVIEGSMCDLVAGRFEAERVPRDYISWMRLAAEVLTMLREPNQDQYIGGFSTDGHPKTRPWQYSGRNHLSVLTQLPNANLLHIPAEAVAALVQAVGDALDQKHSREELAQCCARVQAGQQAHRAAEADRQDEDGPSKLVDLQHSLVDYRAACMATEASIIGVSCQCDEAEPKAIPLPNHLALWEVQIGEQARQDAAQAEYQIRTAAFMGLRIMTDQAVHLAKQGSMIPHLYPERQLSVLSEAPTPLGRGYLSAVPSGEFSQLCEGNLPITIMGADFLHQYGDHYDQQTQVLEGCSYKAAVATRHAITEQQRVKCFSQLLQGPLTTSEQLVNLGELMLQSHASQTQCGLTSAAADRLVGLVQKEASLTRPGEVSKLYGASSVGHAASGVVCILAAAGQTGQQAVDQVIKHFSQDKIRMSMAGSCMGAMDTKSLHNAAHAFCVHVDK
ncbi:hypothetical protein WJX77_011063 [Trebouxia sp. C0004]